MNVPKKWLAAVRWSVLDFGVLSVTLDILNTRLSVHSFATAVPYLVFFLIVRKLDARLTILGASAMILLGFGGLVLMLTAGDNKAAAGYYYVTFAQLGIVAWLWSQKTAAKP